LFLQEQIKDIIIASEQQHCFSALGEVGKLLARVA
jgi:hypothetical protein